MPIEPVGPPPPRDADLERLVFWAAMRAGTVFRSCAESPYRPRIEVPVKIAESVRLDYVRWLECFKEEPMAETEHQPGCPMLGAWDHVDLLATVHEEGRREGIEEAAIQVAKYRGDFIESGGPFSEAAGMREVEKEIRALADPGGEEGETNA